MKCGRVNPILMMRARGINGPMFQRIAPDVCARSLGNFLGSVGGKTTPDKICPVFNGAGDWGSVGYVRCDVVYHDGEYYIADQDHTGSPTTEPGTGADWEDYWIPVVLFDPQAQLWASKTSIVAEAFEGDTAPIPAGFNLQSIDVDGSALVWTLAENPAAAWFTVHALGDGPMDHVEAAFDPTGLAVGLYETTLTITVPGAPESPLTIPIALTINPAGQFILTEAGGFLLTEGDDKVKQESST
jgi:hypothetical protein